jgi:hypothetical protein
VSALKNRRESIEILKVSVECIVMKEGIRIQEIVVGADLVSALDK